MSPSKQIRVYLETGQKRTFACAIDWPGWCRSGRNESSALQALLTYAPRYARALRGESLDPLLSPLPRGTRASAVSSGFEAPSKMSDLVVAERLKGNATTDFGAPAIPLRPDSGPVSEADLDRFQGILKACWEAFDSAVEKAEGRELRRGPRGGGRDLDEIIRHVADAEAAYLSRLGRKLGLSEAEGPDASSRVRQTVLDAMSVAVRSGAPERGPHGGIRWPLRYFVRRVAWHVLDHAWEIEDRTI